MGFRRQDLQEAFFVPGTHAFRVYGYGTADPLVAVLQPGYFDAARAQLRPGELIFVSAGAGNQPRRAGPAQGADDDPGARAALVMVTRNDRGVPVSARLVQDFGGPDGVAPVDREHPENPTPTDAATPARRPRGRPPGSRNKKPA